MKRKFKFGDRVIIAGLEVMVTRAEKNDSFGTTPHYGFQWESKIDGQKLMAMHWEQGWMPVVMFETLAVAASKH